MAYLIVIYFVFLIIFAVFSAMGIYHLWRFGYVGDLTKPFIAGYIIVASIIIAVSIVAILSRPWPATIS